MKRTQLRRITPLRAKKGFNRKGHALSIETPKKRISARSRAMLVLDSIAYYKKIDRKYRYTNQIKDRAWSILSDYVRMRDFIKFGTCVSSGKRINNWRECDAGHYICMGGHGSAVGFFDMNIHAQSKNENRQASFHSGAYYRDELIRRYGPEIIEAINNKQKQSVKADDFYFIAKIKEIHEKFTQLKNEFPDFDYPRYL